MLYPISKIKVIEKMNTLDAIHGKESRRKWNELRRWLDHKAAENRIQSAIEELIEATEEWHSVKDCEAEGRLDCRLCAAIKAYGKACDLDSAKAVGKKANIVIIDDIYYPGER